MNDLHSNWSGSLNQYSLIRYTNREAYLVHSQESVRFEKAVEISKENGNREEFDVGRVSIKVWQELDGFGEEKPQEEYEKYCPRVHNQTISRCARDGLIQQICQEAIVDQSRRIETRKMKGVR